MRTMDDEVNLEHNEIEGRDSYLITASLFDMNLYKLFVLLYDAMSIDDRLSEKSSSPSNGMNTFLL